MKKFLKALTAIVAVAILAFAIVGCAPANVSGKTYVGSDIKITYPSEATEEEKAAMDEMINAMKESITEAELTFNEDGTVTMSELPTGSAVTWAQDGGTVTITMSVMGISQSQEYKVKGNKLEYTETYQGASLTIVMVQK